MVGNPFFGIDIVITIGENQEKSIKQMSVSSIFTDWSIQSISIKSNLPIFTDLSIDKSLPILSIDYAGN